MWRMFSTQAYLLSADVLLEMGSKQTSLVSRYRPLCLSFSVDTRGLHGLKTEARTRPVPEIVWPDPTRPERHS